MKRTYRIATIATASLALMAGAQALAASDYLLELEGVEGEATVRTTLELASWSWGASNPSSSSPRREVTGRPVGQPSAAGLGAHVQRTPAAENGAVMVVASRDAMSGLASGRSACATGKHFPKATLSHAGQRWTLTNVVMSACGAEGMSMTYSTARVSTYDLKAAKK